MCACISRSAASHVTSMGAAAKYGGPCLSLSLHYLLNRASTPGITLKWGVQVHSSVCLNVLIKKKIIKALTQKKSFYIFKIKSNWLKF